MDGAEVYAAAVTGLFAIVVVIAGRQAYLNKRLGDKASREGAAIGAKTPVEVESISVTTMKAALEAANERADDAEARERAARAELEEERRGRRQDREEHRREMQVLEDRFVELQKDFTQLRVELARYKQKFADDPA